MLGHPIVYYDSRFTGTLVTRLKNLPDRHLPYDVCVCGGRDFEEFNFLDHVLATTCQWLKVRMFLSGGARGADRMAMEWAQRHRLGTRSLNARWKAQGKAAGPIRNAELAAELVKLERVVLIAMPGGSGTDDMVMQCNILGIETIEVQDIIDAIRELDARP
jgi:hypothetical protein